MGRPAPHFWWDFVDGAKAVIVQSDYPGGEELARFETPPGQQYMDAQIEQAEQLIADFKAGRKTPNWNKAHGR